MIQPETPDLLHCHQDFAHLTGLCTPDVSPQTHSAITISLRVLLYSSTAVCLQTFCSTPEILVASGMTNFYMERARRKLFSSTKLNFPDTCICIPSFCIPAHLLTLCLCVNHQIFQVEGHFGRLAGEALVWKPNCPYLSNLSHLLIQSRCLAVWEEAEVGPPATDNVASILKH